MSITAADIRKRLSEKYAFDDGWITMAEVTPPKTDRRFDLIAIQGWSSRGHDVHGFEIKVARSDWLRELKEPAKAEPLVRLCSRWWIAAPPGVVQAEELPPAWGLLVIHPEQIRTGRQAPRLEPEPWSDVVWRCMLLRLATREKRTPDDLEAARREGMKQGAESQAATMKAERERSEKREHGLLDVIDKAERATGVRLTSWTDFPALGEAMKLVRNGGYETAAKKMERDAYMLRDCAVRMRLAARALREPAKVTA